MAQIGHTRRRKQFGADRRTEPLPAVAPAAPARALMLGRIALAVTCGAWIAYLATVAGPELLTSPTRSWRSAAETIAYVGIVTLLALSAAAYLVTRQGYLRRTRKHARAPRAEIEAHFAHDAPSATVLISSYQEQPEVILQTVLSAVLQELADLRVVLLIDNAPQPGDADQARLLQFSRNIPALRTFPRDLGRDGRPDARQRPPTPERTMADHDHDHDQDQDQDQPSLRQRLHAATGDRDAEAEAVADRAGDVSERDAKIAVQQARGERGIGTGEPEPDHELATVDDAEAVADDRRSSR